MTYLAKPKFHHPALPKNALGYTHRDYEGSVSTLCAGCGHGYRSRPPSSRPASSWRSSRTGWRKSPASAARQRPRPTSSLMPTASTPCMAACPRWSPAPTAATARPHLSRRLRRRRLRLDRPRPVRPCAAAQPQHGLLIENNGVYGLTKGQFSATADVARRRSATSPATAHRPRRLALQLGAAFVARGSPATRSSWSRSSRPASCTVAPPCSSDLALRHLQRPFGSTKSFDYVRAHNEAVNRLDVITGRAPITVNYEPGTVEIVQQHDGSTLALRKLAADYDIGDRVAAMSFLPAPRCQGPDRHRPPVTVKRRVPRTCTPT